ncbi:hypothetical protein GTCCBUS3UF5_29070 [Geobacillus thermoleovorans CCB_US3_UF5]|uniref:Uncharacterized protein n=2 Tax=Geobacillus TaxID=129337 RepID=A0A1Q5TA50_9BACL|nr:hypothetical protein GTCCBUS3UF5_29070 [Geobacillus thermoleovorans CCB_US3_UF5]OKO97090.1 hypothetical protein BRO54_0103 [Geobacillus proteiniphilus]
MRLRFTILLKILLQLASAPSAAAPSKTLASPSIMKQQPASVNFPL